MIKVDNTVKKESIYIFIWVILLSIVMEIVFLIFGGWNLGVLFGNILGAFTASANFFLMGLTIQKAVGEDEKTAKKRIQSSMAARNVIIIICAALAFAIQGINIITYLIPLFFPRIAVAFRPLFKNGGKNESAK